MENHTVKYGCESKDGCSGFGEGVITCDNEQDAETIFSLIQERPGCFDFAPTEDGEKRLVQYGAKTVYLD